MKGHLSAAPLKNTNPRTIKLPSLREIVLIALLISLYTQVPLQITDAVFVPSFVTVLILAPVMLLMVGHKIFKYEAVFILALLTLFLLSAFLSPGLEFIGQKLLGLLQTVVAVTIGVLTLKLLGGINRSRVAIILLLLSFVLAVGSLLEVAGILRFASDYFREAAYGNGIFTVYDAETRDAQITGFERANFFASEPSVLTKGFLVFVNAWLLISYSNRNLLIGLSLTALLFLTTGSLVLVASAIVSVSLMFANEKSVLSFIVLALGILGIFGTALLALPEVFESAFTRFKGVYELGSNVSLLMNDSIGLRLILPTLTLIEVWKNSPLLGVGISGKEVIGELTGIYVSPTFALGNNNLTSMLTYLGLMGTIGFVLAFLWYIRKIGVHSVALLLWVFAIFSLTGGGFEGPRYWGYVFLLIWAVRERDKQVDASSKRRKLSTNSYMATVVKARLRAKRVLVGRRTP